MRVIMYTCSACGSSERATKGSVLTKVRDVWKFMPCTDRYHFSQRELTDEAVEAALQRISEML